MNEIPKIIHYCWFGKGEMPDALKECMKSWEILKQAGYEIKRWDESNCSFDENDFVRKCFAEKKWGYIGDYYRAKALYEIGGVYLDTDVIIQKPFDELLNQEAFIGFSCDCALCTAVVGAQKGATFIKGILEMYDTGKFYTEESFKNGKTQAENCVAFLVLFAILCTHFRILRPSADILHKTSIYKAYKAGKSLRQLTFFTNCAMKQEKNC